MEMERHGNRSPEGIFIGMAGRLHGSGETSGNG